MQSWVLEPRQGAKRTVSGRHKYYYRFVGHQRNFKPGRVEVIAPDDGATRERDVLNNKTAIVNVWGMFTQNATLLQST